MHEEPACKTFRRFVTQRNCQQCQTLENLELNIFEATELFGHFQLGHTIFASPEGKPEEVLTCPKSLLADRSRLGSGIIVFERLLKTPEKYLVDKPRRECEE